MTRPPVSVAGKKKGIANLYCRIETASTKSSSCVKQLFPHQAGHDLPVLNYSLAEQYVLYLESIFSKPGIKPQRGSSHPAK
jgi:hypothetical protein